MNEPPPPPPPEAPALLRLLREPASVRDAVVLTEILSPPVALR